MSYPEYLEYPDYHGAGVIILLKGSNYPEPAVLLFRESFGRRKNKYTFPGGKREPEDADPIDTVIRETFQETAGQIELTREQLSRSKFFIYDKTYYLYLVDLMNFDKKKYLESLEQLKISGPTENMAFLETSDCATVLLKSLIISLKENIDLLTYRECKNIFLPTTDARLIHLDPFTFRILQMAGIDFLYSTRPKIIYL